VKRRFVKRWVRRWFERLHRDRKRGRGLHSRWTVRGTQEAHAVDLRRPAKAIKVFHPNGTATVYVWKFNWWDDRWDWYNADEPAPLL
jgi:ribosomal protein L32E